jgi:hypothetical protein
VADLVERAREYATGAHRRIDQRRKYSKQPYHVHLEAVARVVASVTDDPEMIAAAWLHDTVEDTQATLEDIEEQFGAAVAELVEELTDISKPGDGNRASRKAVDRRHTAQASARAKTVKLADLIDNCQDITRYDSRFARVYLPEMAALLEVLGEGDPRLLQRARKLYARSAEKVGLHAVSAAGMHDARELDPVGLSGFAGRDIKRLFTEVFVAGDIADSLLSFDAATPGSEAAKAMRLHRQDVASVRIAGVVQGYVRLGDLAEGDCADAIRHFTVDQVLSASATLADVIHVLTRHDGCFVTMLGSVAGVVQRDDINKPVVRMWLFGIVTMVESGLAQMIRERFPDDSWRQHVSAGRLQKVLEIQEERQRRKLACDLVDCLQLSDKAQILIEDSLAMQRLGFDSKSAAKRVAGDLESLRNHLAHAQDIVTHDWAQIARLSRLLDGLAG